MLLAVSKGRAYHFPCSFINYYLTFQRMSFLLPGVKMLLSVVSIFYPFLSADFFLGLSIGVSDASTRITSYSTSLLRRAFLPGSANFPLLINVSSTHLHAR